MPKFKPTEDKAEVKSDALAQAQVRGYFIAAAIRGKGTSR
jgi:hypothetical protein